MKNQEYVIHGNALILGYLTFLMKSTAGLISENSKMPAWIKIRILSYPQSPISFPSLNYFKSENSYYTQSLQEITCFCYCSLPNLC